MAAITSAVIGAGAAIYGAKKNSKAASEAAAAGQFTPYNVNSPFGSATFNGQNINLTPNAQTQYLTDLLQGGAAGLFQNYLSTANNSMSGIGNLINEFQQSNQPNQYTQLGDTFLGALGSANPMALASEYTNKLRQLEAPAETRAANSLANRLAASGRLGSTGGMGMIGELLKQQSLADTARSLAGMQYAGEEQSRLAMLGSNLNQLGAQRINDRFNRALGLFGSGQQASNGFLGGMQAALGQSTALQGGLLNMAQLGAQVGTGASAQNFAAAQPVLQANQAYNNAVMGGLGSVASQIDWGALGSKIGGLFKGGG